MPRLKKQLSIGRLDHTKRSRGLLIGLFSVLLITPDAMLTRWARDLDAEPWRIIFYKQVGSGLITTVGGVYLCGGLIPTLKGIAAAPGHLLFATAIQLINQLGFNFSYLETSAARALLFISLNPLWAGILGRVCLGDELPMRTVIALAFGALSSLIVFVPSLLPGAPKEDSVSIRGDVIAIFTGISLAMWITMMRHTLASRPEASIDITVGFGNLLSGLSALPELLMPGGPGLVGSLGTSFFAVVGINAVCCGVCFVGLVVTPRYLLGAELALILLLEALLGPLWVFFRFGDVPSAWTFAGGAILLGALAVHEIAEIRAKRLEAQTPILGEAFCTERSGTTPSASVSSSRAIRIDAADATSDRVPIPRAEDGHAQRQD